MKNLKKVLALVLAMSTVFGLSVSAGAAATDFNDYAEIENKEAVEIMAALNVIGGNDKGDFNPDGYLTRAEMCKMVSYVMNGGNNPVLGSSATYTYTDTAYSWAKDYIEYATSMGIVGGVGGGKFNPDGTLTGTQAAKMMLTAMGYDANVFGFGGTGWDVNVNRYANEAGLYKGLADLQPNLPITRDQAAQLMYNAIQATMMKRTWNQDMQTGEINETYAPWVESDGTAHTLLGEKFDGAIKLAYLQDFTYDEVKDKWTYNFEANAPIFNGATIDTNKRIENASGTKDLKSSVDYTGFYGQQVKVIYNTEDSDVLYGVYANDSSVVVEGATGNVESTNSSANTVTVAGKDYKLSDAPSAIPVYDFGTGANGYLTSLEADATGSNLSAYTFKMVDNSGDGKIDAVIKTPMTVAKINYVGKDQIQLSSSIPSQKIEDLTTYDGYATGDWVAFINAANAVTGENTIQKLELKTGAISGVRGGANANSYTEYQLDGAWMSVTGNATYNGSVVKADVNDTIEYVALGSTIFYSKITDIAATTKNIAMIVTAGVENGNNSGNLSGNTLQAKLLFADGTTKIVNVSKLNGAAMSSSSSDETALKGKIGTLVTYRVDGSDYELMSVKNDSDPTDKIDDSNLAGYKHFYNTNAGYSNGKVEGYELADDAVVYFIGNATTNDTADDGTFGATSTRKADVYTGKEIKNTWGTDTVTLDISAVLTQEINGFTYAKVVLLGDETGLPVITAGSNYGYLSAPTARTSEDGKTYLNFTIHTANGKLEAKAESTDAPQDYPQGAVIIYDVVSEGVIKNVNIAKVTTGMVTGWDGSSKIAVAPESDPTAITSSEVDTKDTTVLYVDSDKKVGVDGGSIQKAADLDNNGVVDQANVRYVLAASHVVLLVVDVNNEMLVNPAKAANVSVDNNADLLEAVKYDNQNITVTDNVTVTDLHLNGNTVSVASGKTLAVTNLYLEGGDLAGAGTATVTNLYAGSTLSINSFTATNTTVASGKTLDITGGNSNLGTVTGGGKLNVTAGTMTAASVTGNVVVSGGADVTVSGAITGNLTVNAGATGTVNAGAVTGTVVNNSDTGITVGGKPVYKNGQDVKVRAFNVVK